MSTSRIEQREAEEARERRLAELQRQREQAAREAERQERAQRQRQNSQVGRSEPVQGASKADGPRSKKLRDRVERTDFDQITPQGKKALRTMEEIAATATSMYGGRTPNGMCAQAVRMILDAGDFPGADAGRNRSALGLMGAKDYGEYWNNPANARKSGLVQLDITNPFDAPPGSIVIVRPGGNGFNSEWGDINIAVGKGQFINDGNMTASMGQRSDWQPGDLMGVWAPIGADQVPKLALEKLADSAPRPGLAASYIPSGSAGVGPGGSTSGVGTVGPAPSPESPQYWDYDPMPEVMSSYTALMQMLTASYSTDIAAGGAYQAWLAAGNKGDVNQFTLAMLHQMQQGENPYFNLTQMAKRLEAGDPSAQKQLGELAGVLVNGPTKASNVAPKGTFRA